MLRLCAVSIHPLLNDPCLFNKLRERLSTERKEKVDSYKFLKDKALSLCSELLLKYMLESKENVSFRYSVFNKPYLESSNLFFNISHSEEYVLCALSDFEVGCDVEKITTFNSDVAKSFFSKKDNERLKTDYDFFSIWTIKESYVKALGVGLNRAFNTFEIDYKKSTVEDYNFKTFDSIPNYLCSLCSKQELTSVNLEIVDITIL